MTRTTLEQLEEHLGAAPEPLLEHLSATFRIPVARLEDLRAADPAFDIVARDFLDLAGQLGA